MAVNYVSDWVLQIKETVPPLCVEIVLKDGARYYLHSFTAYEKENGSLVLHIWDLRAFTSEDIEELKVALNDVTDRDQLNHEQKIHPKLSWANLRLYLDDIDYCVEWHDRLWPEETRPKIGFAQTEKEESE